MPLKQDPKRSPFSMRFIRFYAAILNAITIIPRCSQSKLQTPPIDGDESLPEEERSCLASFARRRGWLHVTIGLLGMTQTLKELSYFLFTVTSINFGEPARSVRRLDNGGGGGGGGSHQLACLRTNCSRLSSNASLAEDLIRLPIFAVCKPHLKWLLCPITSGHISGLMIYTAAAFFTFTICCLLPLYTWHRRTSIRTLVFIMCPAIETSLARAELRALWVRMRRSMRNFRLGMDRAGRCAAHSASSASSASSLALWARLNLDCAASAAAKRRASREGLQTSQANPPALGDQLVDDCLPVTVSRWWHAQLLRSYSVNTTWVFCYLYLTVGFFHAYLTRVIVEPQQRHAAQYFEYARAANCSIWFAGEAPAELQGRPLQAGHVLHAWTLLTGLIQMVGLFPAVFALISVLVTIHLVVSDMHLSIMELRFEMRLAKELYYLRYLALRARRAAGFKWRRASNLARRCQLQTLLDSKLAGVVGNAAAPPTTAGLTVRELQFVSNSRAPAPNIMRSLRLVFCKLVSYHWSGFRVQRLQQALPFAESASHRCHSSHGRQLNEQIAFQQLAVHLRHQLAAENDEPLVHLLECLQIKYWHHVQFVAGFERPILVATTTVYLINFGFSIISVYFYRRVQDMILLPLIMNASSLVTALICSAWPSTIHSSGRKLEPLHWTLMALSLDEPNPRIRHLRHLWAKQMQLLENSGGVGVRLYGSNVTYVSIIQLLIWTASIMLLSYSRG